MANEGACEAALRLCPKIVGEGGWIPHRKSSLRETISSKGRIFMTLPLERYFKTLFHIPQPKFFK